MFSRAAISIPRASSSRWLEGTNGMSVEVSALGAGSGPSMGHRDGGMGTTSSGMWWGVLVLPVVQRAFSAALPSPCMKAVGCSQDLALSTQVVEGCTLPFAPASNFRA